MMIKVVFIIKLENGLIVMLKGFLVIGIVNGLKKEKKDLGVIVCDVLVLCVVVYIMN